MKNLFVILYLIFSTFNLFSQDKLKIINADSVKEYSMYIGKNLEKKTIMISDDYKEQDASVIVNIAEKKVDLFKDSTGIIILNAFYNGSHGDLESIYLTVNKKVVYVKKVLKLFNMPKYERDSKIIEIIINEYYLNNKEIIVFTTNSKIIRFNTSGGLNLDCKFEEIKNDYKEYMRRFIKD